MYHSPNRRGRGLQSGGLPLAGAKCAEAMLGKSRTRASCAGQGTHPRGPRLLGGRFFEGEGDGRRGRKLAPTGNLDF
jgi:hypothetical protein